MDLVSVSRGFNSISTTSTIQLATTELVFSFYLAPHHFYHFYHLAPAELVFSLPCPASLLPLLPARHSRTRFLFLPCLASLLPVPNPPSLSFSPPTPRGRHPRGMLLPSRRPRVPHVPPPRTTRAATAFLAEPVGTARRHRHTCHPLISHNAARPLCSFSLQDSLFPLPLQPITPSHLLGSADHTHTERAAGSARIARRRKP